MRGHAIHAHWKQPAGMPRPAPLLVREETFPTIEQQVRAARNLLSEEPAPEPEAETAPTGLPVTKRRLDNERAGAGTVVFLLLLVLIVICVIVYLVGSFLSCPFGLCHLVSLFPPIWTGVT